jgi:hypothetical protein
MAEMRPRPFAVERVRRQEQMTPHVRWRRLALQALQLGAAALGEQRGARPDPSGSARWSAITFAAELAQAGAAPPLLDHAEGRLALAMLAHAGRAFASVGPARRRAFAPSLIAAGQLVEDLFLEILR